MNTSDADHDLKSALREHFGFPEFRPGQQAALEHILAGQDTLVVMPTGSGKSLIYQLAALLLPDVTLVISPLIALMKDQTDSLIRRNIRATFINSTLTAAEQSRRLRALARGECKLVYVAPERLRSRAFLETLLPLRISLLAVDEAHCLSQWGHDFRPDYLHIAEARGQFDARVTLALTATATLRVQDDIVRLLNLSSPQRLVTGFNRPNLTFEVFSAPDPAAKLNHVRDFLADAEGAGIIYTGTRRDAEEVAEFVREVAGLETRHYHGMLDPATRAMVQDAFMAGDLPVIVATNAFGMGIDRPDVRFVLHYTMPGTLEAYYQEAGRAGRDGLPARAVLLYSPKDTSLQEFFIENDSPTAADLRAVHNFIQSLSPPLTAALSPTGEGPGVGAGWGPRISFKDIELATGLPETKVRVALDQVEAAGALRRHPEQAYGVFRAEALPLSDSALQSIAAQVASRRKLKRQQLAKIVDYAETNACRRRTILDHFGDTGEADAPICCDNCLSRAEPIEAEFRPAQTQSERAGLIVLDTVARLRWDVGKSKLAQVLKGSSAKDMKAYAQVRNYGKFASLRLSEIEGVISQLIDSGYLKSVIASLADSGPSKGAAGNRPILKLTPRGQTALQTRAAIQVDLRPVQPGGARKLRAEREAGSTVALTGQMLARGLSPEQIAAECGLAVRTIYSHLATLIADGQVSLDSVAPADTQKKIRVAIEKVGSADYLAPIKAQLPEEIDYGVIRCVAEAWRREQATVPSTSPDESGRLLAAEQALARLADFPFEPLRRWRRDHAVALGQPDFYLFGDETLRRIGRGRPHTKAELRSFPGLSAEIFEKYADEIIAVVNAGASAEVSEAILECVRSLPGQLPRSGVAKLLVGSESERVEQYRSHPMYDHLSGRNRQDVTAQVDALLEMGLLARDGKGHLIPAGASSSPSADLFDRLRIWRVEKARSGNVPAFVIFSDEALRGIASERPQSPEGLLAIRGIGPAKVEQYGTEVLAIVAAAGRSSPVQLTPSSPLLRTPLPSDNPVADFLSRPHPRPLKGPWLAGWALDFHSRFDGDEQIRSEVGDLLFRYKYGGEHSLAQELGRRSVDLLRQHPELPLPDAVIPVPPSAKRSFDPVTELARAVAKELNLPLLLDSLIKSRATGLQKEFKSLVQKQANVAGAFVVKGDVRGKRLLVIDDLFDSGATLIEATRALTRAGAASLVVLTLTKTIHADG